MANDDLIWVGAAPLGADEMERLRRDLILQRTVLWVPTGLILTMLLLFLVKLPLSNPESILLLLFSGSVGLVFGRVSGNQRYKRIHEALLEGLDIAPMLHQEGRAFAARILGAPGGSDILDVLMRPHEGGPLSKERISGAELFTRRGGKIRKGPLKVQVRIQSNQECHVLTP